MASRNQLDLFQTGTQPDEGDAAPLYYHGDPDRVRARLVRIIAEARAADTLPWDKARTSLYRKIVPQMTSWLPEAEAAQLRLDFEREMERLKAAA